MMKKKDERKHSSWFKPPRQLLHQEKRVKTREVEGKKQMGGVGSMSCMFAVMVVVSIRIIIMANMRELAESRTTVLVHPVLSLTLPIRATSRARI